MEKDFQEILVLNPNLETIKIIDTIKSLIWTDRYYGAGDFEIYTPVNLELMSFLQQDHYLWRKGSEHLMIIESIEIECDLEEGDHLIVTGRSLESILDRRIVWEQTILTGNFQDAIQTLLNENIISPEMEDRKISNFIFEPSTDPNILSLTVDTQIERGTNLYEAIYTLCFERGVGFKITLSDDKFIFKLYKGQDRSYDQFDNPYVVFSHDFENLINSNYIESKTNLKTVTLIDGEDGSTVVGEGSDLTRREIYTDAKSIYRTIDGVTLTDDEYLAQLEQRGSEVLSEHSFSTSFDGELDSATTYKYGEDFFLGDLVQIINEYGIEVKARIIEMIYSQDLSGLKEYPTFAMDEVRQYVSNGVLTPTPGGSGGGSITDADTVDGKHASDFAPSKFGLGEHMSENPIHDSNDAVTTGMYYVTSEDPNKPPGVTDGSLFVTSHSTEWVNQIYMDWRTNRTYRRSRANGVWSPWDELYIKSDLDTKSDLVGNVGMFSNVAGLFVWRESVTGAIVIVLGTENMMVQADIKLRSYTALAHIVTDGYTYTRSTNWHLPKVIGMVTGLNIKVRFAKRTSDNRRCIILGDADTVWGGHLHVAIPFVSVGYPGNFRSMQPWSISLVTDLSPYTVALTKTLTAV